MTWRNTGVVILVVLLIIFAVWLILEYGFKRWSCTENGCERVMGGRFNTRDECLKSCQGSQTYNCQVNSDGTRKCVEADDGDFTDLDACQANCRAPQVVSVPYPVYSPILVGRRPRRWWKGGWKGKKWGGHHS